MNKEDVIRNIRREAGMTREQADASVKALIGSIIGSLKKGEKVNVLGFGSFSVRRRMSREGISPGTGERIEIPAARVVKFSAGSALRQAVDRKET